MLRKMKLAPKLALIIGSLLTLIFTTLIVITGILSKDAIATAVDGDLTSQSQHNAEKIQQILDTAENAALSIQNYLVKSNELVVADPTRTQLPVYQEAALMCMSSIYSGRVLTSLNYDVEQFLLETARNTATTSEDIAGMGVMFERNLFQKDVKDYAFYVNETDANAMIKPYGVYETYSQLPYYQAAAATKKPLITEPYDLNGVKVLTYAVPILYNNDFQGIIVANLKASSFEKVRVANDRYPSLYSTIYDDAGVIVYDSEAAEDIGRHISDFTPDAQDLQGLLDGMAQGVFFTRETTRENGERVTRYLTPIHAADSIWWSQTALFTRDVNRSVTTTIWWMTSISALALLLLLGVTVFVLRRMLHPIQQVVTAAEKISHGHLDVELAVVSQDEIGILAATFQRMSELLRRMVGDVGYLLGEIAGGNFAADTLDEASYVGDFNALLQSIRKLNDTLSQTLSQINQAAEEVSSGAGQVSSGAQALSQGATEQASTVEELSASMAEISSQIKKTAKSAGSANRLVSHTGSEVQLSNQQMQQLIAAIGNISQQSSEIGKIIKTIDDIAFQTNILALNAAVEAARAGAAGKGFAVVADEVRNLAGKSAQAAKNTTSLIENSIQAVAAGTAIANQTAESLTRVEECTTQAVITVADISQAAGQEANSIAQVSVGIEQISCVVQTNSATAQQAAAAAQELSGQAQLLKDLVGRFHLKKRKGSYMH